MYKSYAHTVCPLVVHIYELYMICSFYGCRDHHGATPKDRLDEDGQAYQELVALLDKYPRQTTNVSMNKQRTTSPL